MTDEVPADAASVVTQLLGEARESCREWDDAETLAVLDTVERVVRNKFPEGAVRDQLLHGCDRVRATVADDPTTAIEYLRAMERLFEE